MMVMRALGLAAFLAAGAVGPGVGVTNSDRVGTTTTPTSPSMSSPNTPSHDGNNQLGSNGTNVARTPRSGNLSGSVPPAGVGVDARHPRATDPGCGGGAC